MPRARGRQARPLWAPRRLESCGCFAFGSPDALGTTRGSPTCQEGSERRSRREKSVHSTRWHLLCQPLPSV